MKESYVNVNGRPIEDIGLGSGPFRRRFPGKSMAYLGREKGPYWVIGTEEYL